MHISLDQHFLATITRMRILGVNLLPGRLKEVFVVEAFMGFALIIVPLPLCAQTEADLWVLCDQHVNVHSHQTSDSNTRPQGEYIHINANFMSAENEHKTLFEGDVHIERANDRMRSDRSEYHFQTEALLLEGNIDYQKEGLSVTADSADFNPEQKNGVFKNADFHIQNGHISGHASKLSRDEDNTTRLIDTRYTTCDLHNPDWEFRAAELTLDHDKGFGFARHSSLRFKNIPFFYFPAVSFPINNVRKSGFLIPEFGISQRRGTELALPYYWNIAPHTDATLGMRNMTQRGLQLQTEWRYMNRWSMNEWNTEFLDDQDFGTERYFYQLTHQGSPWRNWSSFISAGSVSDARYFNDLGNNLSIAAITQIPRTATLSGYYEHVSFSTQWLEFQTVDETITPANKPYASLPRLSLENRYPEMPGGFDYTLQMEWIAFDHEIKPNANRLDIYPRISRPFGSASWFLTPSASIRHSRYQMDRLTIANTRVLERTIPLFSLDGGLFFERSIGHDAHLMQTLEPRLFYLYAPYRPQDHIPVFDTQALDFSIGQLFQENRFIGGDRINDANQLALATSSRFLKKSTGEELFRIGFGQIFYRNDRRVTLPGQNIQSTDRSDLVGELGWSLGGRWLSRLSIEWNPHRQELDQTSAHFRYRRDNQHIINFGYRFRRDILEQTEASFRWPLSQRWRSVGRLQYSLKDKRDLETFAGLEYESCCYIFRIIARRYLNLDEYDSSLFVQLSLKGFSSIGSDAGELLERSILGFREYD